MFDALNTRPYGTVLTKVIGQVLINSVIDDYYKNITSQNIKMKISYYHVIIVINENFFVHKIGCLFMKSANIGR